MRPLAFEPWTDLAVLHVVRHMRASDAAEIFALRSDDDPFALYRDMAMLAPRALWFEVARPAADMQPIAFFGCVAMSPGCGLAHLCATPALTATDATQIAGRVAGQVVPLLRGAYGLHRVEALALARHRWAHRFLKACGARRQEPRPALGRQGEDFIAHVWLATDLDLDPPATEKDPPR